MPRLFRVVVQVTDIDAAAAFYGELLDTPGERVSAGRHYFECGGVVLACFDPTADGDGFDATPNPGHVYVSVPDLEAVKRRAEPLDCQKPPTDIERHPWGERAFYVRDPFGNPLCFVDEGTVFTG